MTVLCLASYEKGHEFLRECKRQSADVVLITSLSLKDKAHWPMDSIAEIFYMPDEDHQWDCVQLVKSVSYVARTREFDRIVPLDDFDVEVAAMLREHLRVPGMGYRSEPMGRMGQAEDRPGRVLGAGSPRRIRRVTSTTVF